ncbi:Uncharacterised protein [Mycobacterium tuberculosis]|nr:Uncharacterised protein [Mycobacterium tuberculosis]
MAIDGPITLEPRFAAFIPPVKLPGLSTVTAGAGGGTAKPVVVGTPAANGVAVTAPLAAPVAAAGLGMPMFPVPGVPGPRIPLAELKLPKPTW